MIFNDDIAMHDIALKEVALNEHMARSMAIIENDKLGEDVADNGPILSSAHA